ncbi:MAG: hypothetical protein M3010_01585 [Candidatus Dormibacteraeota bacterium]|nr:hypothetical protein [Candidatus Dormibacteraeota bacterium]
MSEDLDHLSDRQRARVRARDRKRTPPRVVVDNPGLKKLALHLAEKRRSALAEKRRGALAEKRPAAPSRPRR